MTEDGRMGEGTTGGGGREEMSNIPPNYFVGWVEFEGENDRMREGERDASLAPFYEIKR